MITSHHSNGFWFHITWNGSRGTDQRGGLWFRQGRKAVHESGVWAYPLN